MPGPPMVAGSDRACHSGAGREAARKPRHGTHRTASDLQPRQLRARAPAALPDDRASSGRRVPRSHGPHPVGLADHRQLRFQVPGRLRARAGRDQAAQRRIHAAPAAPRPGADARHAQLDRAPHRRHLRPAPVPGRQGAARPARRGARDPADAEGARHAPGARPARRHGRAAQPARRVAAQERVSGAVRSV